MEHLKVLGADLDHPSSIVEIHAPVSGVITDQQVTAAAGVKTLDNSPNLFTISDLSHVWIICDVYENDMSFVRVGEFADIHLAAYPNVVLEGAHRQYLSHAGPDHPHREGASGSGQFRAAALRDVRHRDIPWIAKAIARHGARDGDSAPARSRLGVCAGREQSIPAHRSGGRKHAAGRSAGDPFGNRARVSRWYRTRWFFNPRSNSKDPSSRT